MTEQPEALRLADALKGQVQVNPRVGENDPDCGYVHELDKLIDEAAAELRRLHAVNAELLAALRLTDIDCQHLHHAHKDRHELGADSPVVARITAAIARSEEPKP
jgi:hypothetical protein